MKRIVGCLLVFAMALPGLRGQGDPKDEKKPPSAREQYTALLKDFNTQRQQSLAEYQKLKGEEQQKQLQHYLGLGKDFAPKFYKLAEENPQDPVAGDALFWVLQNGTGSDEYQKALDQVTTLVAEMPLKDLARRVNLIRGPNAGLMEVVFKRVEKDAESPEAPDLLAWIATNGPFLPIGQKATTRLVEKYRDHAAIERVCEVLSRSGGRVPKAEETLKQILETSSKPKVKATAAMALGQSLAFQADRLGDKPDEADKVAAEAEKYFVMVIDQFAKDNPTLKKTAERDLRALRTLRVGKEAPEIAAADLDEKEFKLSDYRGKVVLLDFWGNW